MKVMRLTRIFVELPSFSADWKDLSLTENDMTRLQEELLANPEVGRRIQGTGGVRKMRFAFEHRGKSGSVRVIYIDFVVYEKIYLLTAYAKNEKENLTQAERNELKKLVHALERELESKRGQE